MSNEDLTYITAIIPESLRDKLEAEFIKACENGYRDVLAKFIGEKIVELFEGNKDHDLYVQLEMTHNEILSLKNRVTQLEARNEE